MTGIYKITSPSGGVYIGQAIDIVKRWRFYEYTCSKSSQTYLFNSFRKHGIQAHVFKIIHELPVDVGKDVLNIYEVFYISLYKDKIEGKVYIGNGKKFESKPVTTSDMPQEGWDTNIPNRQAGAKKESQSASDITEPVNDLPF